MGGSWVKQVELDEPMQVSDIHLHLPCRHRDDGQASMESFVILYFYTHVADL